MSFDLERLFSLLPALYRNKDAENGYPLKALLSVIARETRILELNLDYLYDDLFIETCAEWAIPYIGDLIGARGLDSRWKARFSQRAQVANTLAYRRRKGTAAVIEQIAHDVTGYGARAVEFFKLLDTSQHMNHIRPNNLAMPDLRRREPLELLGTPFETISHTLDVRRISSRRGRYNIPNIGLFLWRLRSYHITDSPAYEIKKGCYTFNPLGSDIQLYSQGRTEEEISHMAEPLDIPMKLSPKMLEGNEHHYYGENCSFFIRVEGTGTDPDRAIDPEDIVVCDLSDASGGGKAFNPDMGTCAVDPVRGRLRLAINVNDDVAAKSPRVYVSYHYGFSADIGGGEYERSESFDSDLHPIYKVSHDKKQAKYLHSINDAMAQILENGVVEIHDSGRYEEVLNINASESSRIELRAANKIRPLLMLKNDLKIVRTEDAGVLNARKDLDMGPEVSFNGLLISGFPVCATGRLKKLRLSHCTLVPGLSLHANGEPQSPNHPSLVIDSGTSVEIDSCILGGMRVSKDAHVKITNSILDATDESNVAYSGLDGSGPGGPIRIENCTIIGKVHAVELELASNSIFVSELRRTNNTPGNVDPWKGAVWIENRQKGCVRFSYLPLDSCVPRKYSCQPDMAQSSIEEKAKCPRGKIPDKVELEKAKFKEADRVNPIFKSTRYGKPDYCQLSLRCATEITKGADDESEMGAFHNLFNPQREASLKLLLDEYLRFGLELGIFYES